MQKINANNIRAEPLPDKPTGVVRIALAHNMYALKIKSQPVERT